MLMVGCDGGTNATSNVVPEITRRIYDLCRAGNFQEAMQWNYRILALFDTMLYPFEFPDGFRAAASLRGFDFGAGRLPQTGAQKTDRAEMAKVLQCMLADFDVVARPPEGCAPCTPPPATDKLEQAVFEVMRELEKRRMS
jgi:4-hydroxy-tetrahydrodipicolinate synthase